MTLIRSETGPFPEISPDETAPETSIAQDAPETSTDDADAAEISIGKVADETSSVEEAVGEDSLVESAADQTRWALLIEYDGTDYVGWQYQPNGKSVQQTIEEALERLAGHRVRVVGAGRTDAGVHALGQAAAFNTSRRFQPHNVVRGGNAYLPASIRIKAAQTVPMEFNPRRDAIRRHYRYRLLHQGSAPALDRNRVGWIAERIDWDRVRQTLDAMRGVHEFGAFRAASCTARRTRLDLERSELSHPIQEGGQGPNRGVEAQFDFVCRSFLQKMVRLLVGACLEVGRGRLEAQSVVDMLENGRREYHIWPPAPPQGLYLMSVEYPEHWELWKGGNPTI